MPTQLSDKEAALLSGKICSNPGDAAVKDLCDKDFFKVAEYLKAGRIDPETGREIRPLTPPTPTLGGKKSKKSAKKRANKSSKRRASKKSRKTRRK